MYMHNNQQQNIQNVFLKISNYNNNGYNDKNIQQNHHKNSQQMKVDSDNHKKLNGNASNMNMNIMTGSDDNDMDQVFMMMSKLNLDIYAQIASQYKNCDRDTIRKYLTIQLMNDLTKMGYTKQQQQDTTFNKVVDLISQFLN